MDLAPLGGFDVGSVYSLHQKHDGVFCQSQDHNNLHINGLSENQTVLGKGWHAISYFPPDTANRGCCKVRILGSAVANKENYIKPSTKDMKTNMINSLKIAAFVLPLAALTSAYGAVSVNFNLSDLPSNPSYEEILNYYNGGADQNGAIGPNYGITFGPDALALLNY